MDGHRFDALARRLATPRSRRTLLRGLTGGILASVGLGHAAMARCPRERPIRCEGTCVDLRTDPAHCGRCGAACDDGQVCYAGRCLDGCPHGFTPCADSCARTCSGELQPDPADGCACGCPDPAVPIQCGDRCLAPGSCCTDAECTDGSQCHIAACAPEDPAADETGCVVSPSDALCGEGELCCAGMCVTGTCCTDDDCTGVNSCGGGGVPYVCGCTPSCDGANCGDFDGCGGRCAGSCPDCTLCNTSSGVPFCSSQGVESESSCDGGNGRCCGSACVSPCHPPGTTCFVGPCTNTPHCSACCDEFIVSEGGGFVCTCPAGYISCDGSCVEGDCCSDDDCAAFETCGGGGMDNVCGCITDCEGANCGDADGCGGYCAGSCPECFVCNTETSTPVCLSAGAFPHTPCDGGAGRCCGTTCVSPCHPAGTTCFVGTCENRPHCAACCDGSIVDGTGFVCL